jgi:hypothetical protein
LIVATGHRKPYAFLLPIAILTVFQCCANVAWTVINYTAYVDPPNSLYPPLAAISALFANWTTALLYLAVICVVLDRRTAINAATEGQADKTHVVLIIARIVLFLLMFVLGTAYGALQTKYYQTFYSDNWTSQELFNLSETSRKVLYAFTAFFSITAIDVVASSVMLYNVAGKARVTDKVAVLVRIFWHIVDLDLHR